MSGAREGRSGAGPVLAVVLVVLGIVGRLVPHPWNVTPIGGASLLAGATLSRRAAVLVPVVALAVSDLLIGTHPLVWATWGSCALVALLGNRFLRERHGVVRVGTTSVAGSMTFFAVTNLAVWLQSGIYERTAAGLVECYVAALPFLRNSLLGDLAWTGALFGAWALATRLAAGRSIAVEGVGVRRP
jgi:hypothetical protein